MTRQKKLSRNCHSSKVAVNCSWQVIVTCCRESMAECPAACCSCWCSCCSFCCTRCCLCCVFTWCWWQHWWSSVDTDDAPPPPATAAVSGLADWLGTGAADDCAASFTYVWTTASCNNYHDSNYDNCSVTATHADHDTLHHGQRVVNNSGLSKNNGDTFRKITRSLNLAIAASVVSSVNLIISQESVRQYRNAQIPEAHTHPFNGPLSGTTQLSQYQKGKTNLDFTEARDR